MAQRIFWSAVGAMLAAAAIAAPASAAQLVFDVTITGYTDFDALGDVTGTTPFDLQFTQTFQVPGLPPLGASAFDTPLVTPASTRIRNILQFGNVTAGATPLDAVMASIANNPPRAPDSASSELLALESTVHFTGGPDFQQVKAGVDVSQSYFAGDDIHYSGSDLSTDLSYDPGGVSAPFLADPTPRTVGGMLDLMAGFSFVYTLEADSYDVTSAPDGSVLSALGGGRQYKGTAVLDLGQSSVPEPQAWALMLAGFAAVGAGLRRARRTPSAAA